MWLYGSGFPKSMDISKQIDKRANIDKLPIIGNWLKLTREKLNLTREFVANELNLTTTAIYNWEEKPIQYGFPTKENWNKLKQLYKFDGTWDDFKKEAEREVIGQKESNAVDNYKWLSEDYKEHKSNLVDITKPATKLAKQWEGWGTCLKPAYEPIIVARKPFKGSLVDNIIENGVGGINIDGCRVETNGELIDKHITKGIPFMRNAEDYEQLDRSKSNLGRFPANVIHDGSKEVSSNMPYSKSGNISKEYKQQMRFDIANKGNGGNLDFSNCYGDEGSASRYFYCAKASKKDRDEGLNLFNDEVVNDGKNKPSDNPFQRGQTLRKNTHPTVKPTELMQYLVRLVSPKGATILDPFMGSGSTGKAVMYENLDRNADYTFIGIEKEKEYCDIARARINYVAKKIDDK